MRQKDQNRTDAIYTKIAGTSSGDDATTRQLALRIISEMEDKQRPRYLDLVPDPNNKFDEDAIQVIVTLPSLGRVQLGFLRNATTICDTCNKEYDAFPKPKDGAKNPMCARCGSDHTHLRRNGVATLISAEMKKDTNTRFYAELLEVTGGTEGKANYGANIVIRRVIDRKVAE